MNNYIVLLDLPIFKKEISDSAVRFITSNKTIISKTFSTEANLISKVLNKENEKFLRKNLLRIINLIKEDKMKLFFSQKTFEETFDIYQHAIELSAQGMKVCVVTENLTNIRYLRSHTESVDIYDLNNDNLIHNDTQYSANMFIDIPSNDYICEIKEGRQLTTARNESIILENEIGMGTEAKIFNIKENPEAVAKIYKKYPSSTKIDHLEELKDLNKQLNLSWCVLPTDLIYDESNKVIGYIMPKQNIQILSNDSLFLGDIEDIEMERLSCKRSYVLKFCTTFLSQLLVLQSYGILISDFNEANFSIYSTSEPIIMIDTDSYIYENYFGNYTNDNCFSRIYDLTKYNQLEQMCQESAIKFVFKLISLGLNPFPGKNTPYHFSVEGSGFSYRKYYFPNNVLSYINEVFTGQTTPSISVLLYNLDIALEFLQNKPEIDISISHMITKTNNTQPYIVTIDNNKKSNPNPYPSHTHKTYEIESNIKNQFISFDNKDKKKVKKKKKHSFWKWAIFLTLTSGALFHLISWLAQL